MDDTRLLALKEELEHVVTSYKELVQDYQSRDFIRENEKLAQELADVKSRLEKLNEKYEQANEENKYLKTALREQILDEKLNIIKVSRQKLQTYFKAEAGSADNALTQLERKCSVQLQELHKEVEKNLSSDKELFAQQIALLSTQVKEKINARRKELEQERLALLNSTISQLDSITDQEVTEEQLYARVRQNEIEMKIGLNWFNRIGILLILFGVGAAFRYTYSLWFTDYMKGTVFYLLGVILLAGGEVCFRKDNKIFSTGLISGGVAVLFSSTFFSYFLLGILGQNITVFLLLLISILAVLMSLRYKSRTICVLGLIGGYFPYISYVMSYGLSGINYPAAFAYLFLLNTSVLLLSFRQRWTILTYFSFALHLPSFLVLASVGPNYILSMSYTFIFFLLYLTMTLGYPLLHKVALKSSDIVLLGLNTFFSFVILYTLFDTADWKLYLGLLALTFSIIFIILARFTDKTSTEQSAVTLFYITSLTFAVLMIPFQFGVQWLSLGWMVEGVLLITFGYLRGMRQMERAGWVIFCLCLMAFGLIDFPNALSPYSSENYFHVKYFFVTVGLLLPLAAYLSGKQNTSILDDYLSVYKYLVLGNLWFYLVYSGLSAYNVYIPYHGLFSFYQALLFSFITILTGYVYGKIPVIADAGMRVITVTLLTLGTLAIFYTNSSIPVLSPGVQPPVAEVTALTILVLCNILVLIVVREAVLAVIRLRYASLEFYPLIPAIWLLINTTAFLIVQFGLSTVNLAISIVYLLLAVGFVIYGLSKRYIYIRRFGLVLALLAIAKLFLYDLSFLSAMGKIFAYFCFGIILVLISFLYQKLEKGWEGDNHAKFL